jgi:hypothetical protein
LDDEFLTKIAFVYAEDLKYGYIGLDSEDWHIWLRCHPETLQDVGFFCGFVPQLANPIVSIGEMLQREALARKVLLASVRYAGIGISVSRKGSVFFAIFVANIG